MMKHSPLLAACLVALALVACGGGKGTTEPAQGTPSTSAEPGTAAAPLPAARHATPAKPQGAVPRADVGTVTAIQPIYQSKPTSGVGAVLGTVVGAAVGHQFGGGDGKKLATAVGAVGGAVAGNKIEQDRNTQLTGYRVSVRHDDGRVSDHTLAQLGSLSQGQRVRVLNGQVTPA